MNDHPHYAMVIWWSDEDDAFLVTLPDWDRIIRNPVTHGDTYEEAVRNGQEALGALIGSLRRRSEPLPESHVPAVLLP